MKILFYNWFMMPFLLIYKWDEEETQWEVRANIWYFYGANCCIYYSMCWCFITKFVKWAMQGSKLLFFPFLILLAIRNGKTMPYKFSSLLFSSWLIGILCRINDLLHEINWKFSQFDSICFEFWDLRLFAVRKFMCWLFLFMSFQVHWNL